MRAVSWVALRAVKWVELWAAKKVELKAESWAGWMAAMLVAPMVVKMAGKKVD